MKSRKKTAPKPIEPKKFNPFNLTILFTLMFLVAIGVVLVAYFKDIAEENKWGDTFTRVLITPNGGSRIGFLIGLLGVVLYKLKQKQQFWYGVAELTFAFLNGSFVSISIHESIDKGGNSGVFIIGAISSVYLIVRGASNMQDGYPKPFFLKERLDRYL